MAGEFAEADQLFAEANSAELPDRLRAAIHEHAGRSAFEQGRYIEACNHFEQALDLRGDGDPELVARTEVALDAVVRAGRARRAGGRTRAAATRSCGPRRPPTPTLDERRGRGGTPDADGVVDPARYAEAQPFRDGVAWVRRPGARPGS